MKRTYIKDLKENIGKEVSISGFIHFIRDQGGIKFLIIRDNSGLVQVVVLKSEQNVFEMIGTLTLESVVSVSGLVKEEKQAPGGFEIQAKEIEILSKADANIPIPVVEEKGAEEVDVTKRFDYRWLDLRKAGSQKIFKLWTDLEKGMREYFLSNGFTQLYTPSLMSTASEGGADVFEVKYFDKKAYLCQSPQFYKQMGIASGFDRVFMVGPVFRAEPSFTTRHVTEFTGWDFEMGYIDSHEDVMETLEGLLSSMFKSVDDLEEPTIPFPRMTMGEVKERLKKEGVTSEKEHDISPEEERKICEIVKKETGSDFLFIKDYHISVRPFYHMRHKDNPELTKSFDLLYKGVEIVTGAQREHRVEILVSQAKEKGVDIKDIENYVNFFKYGCPPHGGIGMGPARLIMRILDVPSIKEVMFLPRDVKRLTP